MWNTSKIKCKYKTWQNQKPRSDVCVWHDWKSQGPTYDAAKECILQELQWTLTNGERIVDDLQIESNTGMNNQKPNKKMVVKRGMSDEDETDAAVALLMQAEQNLEQQDMNMECQIDLKACEDHELTCKANEWKVHTILFNCCDKIVQNRVEDSSNFESNIWNDPFALLATITMKMCGQAQVKYKCFR